MGYRVVTASDGVKGLVMAQRYHPDLIITDFMMPGMDGIKLCERLKADPALATIPVILWTAAMVTFGERLFDRLLSKPVDPERLAGEISSLLPW